MPLFNFGLNKRNEGKDMEYREQHSELTGGQLTGGYDNAESQNRGGSTFEQIRSTVAEKLQSAAQTLHQKTAGSNQQNEFTDFGKRAANWLEYSADYVNHIEPAQVRSDIENKVRRNPGRSLLIAGAVGLVLGGLLRRR